MLETNEVEVPVLREIVGKTEIDKIRSHKIRVSCGIHIFITEWMERRRELDEYITRMDA